jgi:5-methylphenazine-1-carboxylate 1-monooxygenase
VPDRAELRRHLSRFRVPDVDHKALIEATAECYEFPMCDRDPMPHWTQGRVTLLGDAAHPIYPMGSNGAGQAVLDAESVSRHLAGHADPGQALHGYEAGPRPARWCRATGSAGRKA